MNRDLTPTVVEQRLAELSKALDDAVKNLAVLDETWVRAKHAYELAYARAYLTAEGKTVDDRKANALPVVADLLFTQELAEAVLRAAKEQVRTLRTQIDVGRSLGAGLRAGWSATP